MTDAARHARWPWFALGVFLSLAVVGLILVAVNNESLAEQIPYVIAFTLFGVVGALLLSRMRGNRIGGLLLYGAAITGASFAASELATYLAERGHLDSPLVIVASLVSSIGWLMGIFPVILFLPLLFPDGHLPSRRWLPFAWLSVAVLVFLGLSLVLGEKSLYGSGDNAIVANPHPSGTNCAAIAVAEYNRQIAAKFGIDHLITCIVPPTLNRIPIASDHRSRPP